MVEQIICKFVGFRLYHIYNDILGIRRKSAKPNIVDEYALYSNLPDNMQYQFIYKDLLDFVI